MAPTAPTLTLEQLTATSLRATIDGPAGATITNYLVYMQSGDAAWSDGGDCSGDDTIDLEDLTTGQTYMLASYAYDSDADAYSPPSTVEVITLAADADDGTPTGSLSLALSLLETTLAASSTFRQWVEATEGTEEENILAAKSRIYEWAESDFTRPYAMMAPGENFEMEQIAGGARNFYQRRGSLDLWFEAAVAEGDDEKTAGYKYRNKVGTIMDEMRLVAGTAGYLNITGMRVGEEQIRCNASEYDSGNTKEDFWQVRLSIEYSD